MRCESEMSLTNAAAAKMNVANIRNKGEWEVGCVKHVKLGY